MPRTVGGERTPGSLGEGVGGPRESAAEVEVGVRRSTATPGVGMLLLTEVAARSLVAVRRGRARNSALR